MYTNNLVNGFRNPGAQIIFSLHPTNLNPGEIIPASPHANLIAITTCSHFVIKIFLMQRTETALLTVQSRQVLVVYIVTFRRGMKILLWLGNALRRSSHLLSHSFKASVFNSLLH